MTWQPVIGIEVHIELMTASKMFCGCAVEFGGEPNTRVCPTCLGLPGAMPVPNRAAIESIMAIGQALNCRVSTQSVFHRKNYFYPDLPKNYQISQFDIPVCVDGYLDVEVDVGTRRVGIERAHMEEDTGKSTHIGAGGRIHSAETTLLDFNRSGVPLVEVVTRPDIRSALEARAYAQELRAIVAETGLSDAKLEEGSIRFDANISIRPDGREELGTKVEVKNMNSFRSLERAVDHEIERQIGVCESGGSVIQETRHWDEEAGVTHSMRVKEGSSDYRYFVEPDLTPMVMDDEWITAVRRTIPELPAQRRTRYQTHGLDRSLAVVMSAADPVLRALYEEALAEGADSRAAANWVSGELTGWARKNQVDPEDVSLSGRDLAELVGLIGDGVLSSSAAKVVLGGVLSGEGSPQQVADARDLMQITDSSALESVVAEVMAAHASVVDDYRSGEQKLIGFLVGQVMKATQGKADPSAVNRMLREELDG